MFDPIQREMDHRDANPNNWWSSLASGLNLVEGFVSTGLTEEDDIRSYISLELHDKILLMSDVFGIKTKFWDGGTKDMFRNLSLILPFQLIFPCCSGVP